MVSSLDDGADTATGKVVDVALSAGDEDGSTAGTKKELSKWFVTVVVVVPHFVVQAADNASADSEVYKLLAGGWTKVTVA
jgi:hypothetical protein